MQVCWRSPSSWRKHSRSCEIDDHDADVTEIVIIRDCYCDVSHNCFCVLSHDHCLRKTRFFHCSITGTATKFEGPRVQTRSHDKNVNIVIGSNKLKDSNKQSHTQSTPCFIQPSDSGYFLQREGHHCDRVARVLCNGFWNCMATCCLGSAVCNLRREFRLMTNIVRVCLFQCR